MHLWNGGFEEIRAVIFKTISNFYFERFNVRQAEVEGKICVKENRKY